MKILGIIFLILLAALMLKFWERTLMLVFIALSLAGIMAIGYSFILTLALPFHLYDGRGLEYAGQVLLWWGCSIPCTAIGLLAGTFFAEEADLKSRGYR
ncbi:MAG: hypothetical protein JJ964_05875 [Rhizobiales bacterium]|nr:hypothetical protein [Hyphomicrobiales bacterium]